MHRFDVSNTNFPKIESSMRLAVLSGGDSGERAVSLLSGAAVVEALTKRGHLVIPMDPAIVDLAGVDWRAFDAVFIALHGSFGEDGQVQQLLEVAGIPYTGSDPVASRLAFSKSAAKEKFLQFGVPTPPYALVHFSTEWHRVETQAAALGYPLVVKPESQGSSLGVSLVRSAEELSSAMRTAFKYDGFVLMEKAILGPEWTVALCDDRIFPAIRIRTPQIVFDYQAKYLDDETGYEIPNPAEAARISETAQQACRALGTSGLVRVDLRLDADGHPSVLEVNTSPGMTDHSLVPKAAAAAGIEFADLCELVISMALARRSSKPHHFAKPQIRQSAS